MLWAQLGICLTKQASFQSTLETFQCQFWIYNVSRQRVPHDRSGDTEASWPEATRPGTRCGKVSLCSRRKVGSGPDFRDGDAGSTGPRPWSKFRTKVAILKMMHWRMGSQWSCSLSRPATIRQLSIHGYCSEFLIYGCPFWCQPVADKGIWKSLHVPNLDNSFRCCMQLALVYF